MDIYFLGIVTGVESSISQFPLDKGLKNNYSDINGVHKKLADITSMPIRAIERTSRDRNWANQSESKIATVEGIFSLNINSTNSILFWDALEKINDDIIKGYLLKTVSYMRLYQEGMISLGDRWLYCYDNGMPQLLGAFSTSGPSITYPHFIIGNSAVAAMDKFVRDMHDHYPNDDRFVKSINAFNRSYQLQFTDPDLSFLALHASLECLLSKKSYPSKKFIENVSKVVTKDTSRGFKYDDVKKKMGEYYIDRCDIAHNLGIMNVAPIIPEIEGIRKFARICIEEGVQYHRKGLDILTEAEKLTP